MTLVSIPRSFVVYTKDATDIFLQHHHIFADDMQGTKHAKPSQVSNVSAELGSCVSVTIFMNNREHEVRMSIYENRILFTANIIHQFNTDQRYKTHDRTVRSHDDLLFCDENSSLVDQDDVRE